MMPGAFGKYVVVEVIGRGGMADVYRARHPTLDRDVAIKAIHAHLATEPGFIDRFVHEARLVASLRHPGIVQVHDFDVADGRPYMVMEYVGGGTLKDRLARARAEHGRMAMVEAGRFLVPIADALDYAHGRGAVHRDLKPANILLTPAGAPVLSDFGIARILEDAVQMTATGALVGTPAYMSPEQAAGRPVDARSDQYALGVVLYEMTTGRVPFVGGSPTAVMLQHLQDPPPDPRLFDPDMPEPVRAVILRALAKDPGERFVSAGAMAAAFGAACEGTLEEAAAGAGPPADAPTVLAAAAGAEAGADGTLVPGAAPTSAGSTLVPGAAAGATLVPGAALVPGASSPGPTVVVPPPSPSAGVPAAPGPGAAGTRTRGSAGRRAPLIVAAVVVLVAVAGGAALVLGGGGGGAGGGSPSPAPPAGSRAAGGAGSSGSAVLPGSSSPGASASRSIATQVASAPPPASASPSAAAAPSPTPPASPLPTPTPVPPTPAAVVKPGACPSSSDAVIYRADFAKAGSGWPERKDGKVLVAYTDGAYHVTVTDPYHWWSAFYEPTDLPAKYAVGLRTWPASGPGTGEYGVYFAGIDKNDTFELEIRDTGEYRVVKIAGGEPTDLVPWTATGRLSPGAANTLAVAVRGKVATICINGTPVTAVKDADLRTGRVGMVAESEAEELDVMFDDFTLWTLR